MNKVLRIFGRIDFIPMQRRKKIIWKLQKIFKVKDINFRIDFFGLNYDGNTKNQIDKYVYYFGAYEKGLLRFIEEKLKESSSKIFIDVGGNVGHHSLFASRIASKVYSFEPYSNVRKEMENKISINNIKNVEIIPYGLGEEDQELVYYEPADRNTGTGSFVKDFIPENKDKGLKLHIKNGEDLFRELNIQKISLIKVDTEGFEPIVLSGLLSRLKKDRPIIIMEYSHATMGLFDGRPELSNFLKNEHDMFIFSNPNDFYYKLLKWNFDQFGNIVFIPK